MEEQNESHREEPDESNGKSCEELEDIKETGGEKLRRSEDRPKNNTIIQYSLEGHIHKARVLSTQPKSVGKWKGWLNVHVVGENKSSSVDWSRVLWWRQVEGETNQVLVLSEVEENNQEILEAKEEEYNKLVENDVFEWIEDTGEKTISTKWFIEEKCNSDGTKRTKARLVARGFEERLVDKRVDSPTASRQALRMIFTTASTMEWELHSLDIASAFLQGKEIERRVVVRPPEDLMEEGKVWKLKRCLYGLSDAPSDGTIKWKRR